MLRTIFFTLAIFVSTFSFAQTEQKVSDEQLKQFANAYQIVQQESMKVQQEMMGVIQEAGLQPQRFNEMYQAKNNPNKTVEATDEEKKMFEKAMGKIESMQASIQAKMEEKVKSSGMDMKTYESIMNKMRTSPELQKRIQTLMMSQGQGK